MTIRTITTADAEKALAVYKPYVEHTAISFEYEVPLLKDFTEKIEKITAQYPWLVCESEGEIAGYVYGSTHRERTGYQWSPEATVYMSEKFHRRGIARIMYEALFELLRMQGYFSVYAGILSTNTGSVEFHRALGFEEIGLYKNIGYKLGEWHSNLWMQLFLQEHIIAPPAPVPVRELYGTPEFKKIIARANERVKMLTSYHGNETQLREVR